jgi:hypothetical protein
MVCSDKDHGRSRRSGVEDQGWSHRLGTQWSGDREVVGAVCDLYRACGDEEHGFLC